MASSCVARFLRASARKSVGLKSAPTHANRFGGRFLFVEILPARLERGRTVSLDSRVSSKSQRMRREEIRPRLLFSSTRAIGRDGFSKERKAILIS
jgi:hypothetical protein